MSLHLGEEDRATLRRLESGRMKPTRRQKAIALLRLAAGLTPAEAAEHAGIPKEQVEALAVRFARRGLGGVGLDGGPMVSLVRLGIGAQRYSLPKGATLANLLRQSEAKAENQAIYVDGFLVDETAPLRDGAVVVVVPRPVVAAGDEPWRATIPSFQDEGLFRQYTEILKARRRDPSTDEDSEA